MSKEEKTDTPKPNAADNVEENLVQEQPQPQPEPVPEPEPQPESDPEPQPEPQDGESKAEEPTDGDNPLAGHGLKDKLYSPVAVWAIRVLIGAVFVVSGFTKIVDPWGFIFKIEDYLAAMGQDPLRSISMVGSMGIASFELIAGLLLATGCFKRVAPWLMTALMAVMLPLTLWTWVADPVADCGCFGEAFILSNMATFWKNVLIMAGLIYLCVYNSRTRSAIFIPGVQCIVVVVGMLYCLFVGLYGYNIQPMVDFRPYPAGLNLAEALTSDNEADEEVEMEFIYEKNGQKQTFAIDELPDSTWTFVDRKIVDDVITMAPEAKSESNFAIYDRDDDVTSDVIASDGEQLLLVIPEGKYADIAYSYHANEFNKAMQRSGGTMVGLIAAPAERIAEWVDLSMSDYPYYTVEDTSLKQLARGTMSIVYLRDGVIQWKRTLSSFDFDTVDRIGKGDMKMEEIKVYDRSLLQGVTIAAMIFLMALALFQEIIGQIYHKIKKKRVTLQS